MALIWPSVYLSVEKTMYVAGVKSFLNYLRRFVSLVSLLFSVNATALNCPGPQDFVHSNGSLWGWSWDLSPSQRTDFTALSSSWTFYSPYEQNFSPDYPLTVGITWIETNKITGATTARLYCEYTLPSGERLSSVTISKRNLNKDEFNRIISTWSKGNMALKGGDVLYSIVKYDCSTTAGAPEKCSVNFS